MLGGLTWIEPDLLAQLPPAVVSQLQEHIQRVMRSEWFPEKGITYILKALQKLAAHSNGNGVDRPGRKRHAAALVTYDGYVIFGVNRRNMRPNEVQCAETTAGETAMALGFEDFVAAFVYSPDYDDPFTCEICGARLSGRAHSEHRNMGLFFCGNDGTRAASHLMDLMPRSYAAKEFAADEPKAENGGRTDPPTKGEIVFQLSRPALAALVTDSRARARYPQGCVDEVDPVLRKLLERSNYHGLENGGVSPDAAAVVTPKGKVICGVNVRYGNPPLCTDAVVNAVSTACTLGEHEFIAALLLKGDSPKSHPDVAVRPFSGSALDVLEMHLPPKEEELLLVCDGRAVKWSVHRPPFVR